MSTEHLHKLIQIRKWQELVLKAIKSSSNKPSLEILYVVGNPKNVLETADAIIMAQKLMIMIFKFD